MVAMAVSLGLWAIPASPKVLQALLEAGDTARYEQMIHHDQLQRHRAAQMRGRTSARRAPQEFGVTPLLAERGLLILANFSDLQFRAENTQVELDSMMNGYQYNHDGATGSAAQYYSDQSNGQYRPHFDVVGPITLPKRMAYYGKGPDDDHLGDFVIHCCSIASEIEGVNLADYDLDNDGWMDFVYIIYAGYNEAESSVTDQIWPASWDLPAAIYGGYSELQSGDYGDYDKPEKYTYDGVAIGSFAYSSELKGRSGSRRAGIGTPTHEFAHVLGLPDFYDVYYGKNEGLTPDEWDLMDSGGYNNEGKTPPNLSAWEKAFMGWIEPINPGTIGANVRLAANGTEDYSALQINADGEQQSATTEGVNYYVEYRKKTGWDSYIPSESVVVWKVDYDRDIWIANEPNAGYSRDYGAPNVNKDSKLCYSIQEVRSNSWTKLAGRELKDITYNQDGTVSMVYIRETQTEEDVVNAQTRETTTKALCNGQIIIRRNGTAYDTLGRVIKP